MNIISKIYSYYGFYFCFIFPVLLFWLNGKRKKRLAEPADSLGDTLFSVLYFMISASAALGLTELSFFSALSKRHVGVILLFILFCTLVSFVLLRAEGLFLRNYRKLFSLAVWKKCRYGIAAFLLLCISLYEHLPQKVEMWSAWNYAVDYSMGFGSRLLIGSMLTRLTGNFVPASAAFAVCVAGCVLLCLLLAVLCQRLIDRSDEALRPALLFLIACALCAPASVTSMFRIDLFGKLDLYVLVIVLFAVLLFEGIRNTYLKYLALIVCSLLANAVYQGYMFLYFTIIFIVMLYDIHSADRRLGKVISAGVTTAVSVASFLIFQFGSHVKYSDAEAMTQALRQKTDLSVTTAAIEYEYFRPVSYAYRMMQLPYIGNCHGRLLLLFALFLILPLLILLVHLYRRSFSLQGAKVRFRTPLLYGSLSLFFILPQFFLNVDWGRWMIALVFNSVFLILYSVYRKDPATTAAMCELSEWVRRHTVFAVFVVGYLFLLDKFTGARVTYDVDQLHDRIAGFFRFIR